MENKFEISKNYWDEELLKISCCRITIKGDLDLKDIKEISQDIIKYDFITVVNKKLTIQNSVILSTIIGIYLADVNIKYECKNPTSNKKILDYKKIVLSKDSNLISQVKSISNFEDSRFINDYRLNALGGIKVYDKWIDTAVNDDRKFAIYLNDNNEVEGYILFKENINSIIIELINVSHSIQNRGIGKKLINYLYYIAEKDNKSVIVGTQLTNKIANNFYRKMGFIQTDVSYIYHKWNI
ncbi:MAG: GNAT family N-acetyltransferase [Tenericutes bacterium]|nr:GNAT family N-acetyltransferase [Mycoplasmatota bacterium]